MFCHATRILGLCLLHTLLALNLANGAEPFQLRGVEPGKTTGRELDGNARWGKPQSSQRDPQGAEQRVYELRGYNGVSVLLHDGVVQTIDVRMPDNLPADTAAALLQLGNPQPDKKLPAAAALGTKRDDAWQATPYSGGLVVLYLDPKTKHARLLRVYADRVVPLVAQSAIPAPPAPGDPSGIDLPEPVDNLTGSTQEQRQALRLAAEYLGRYHFAQHPVDDEIANRTFSNLLNMMDGYKLYFRHEDYTRFRRRMINFADELKDGNSSLMYEMLRTRVERTRQAVKLAIELLNEEHDFTIDESLVLDNENAVYMENDLEAREVWRKQVKQQLLTHLSAGASLEIARVRATRYYLKYLQVWQAYDDAALHSNLIQQLALAYDPHCAYFGPKRQEEFVQNLEQQLVGIGLSGKLDGSYYIVQAVLVGGPAEQDGRIQVGDRVIAVGETPGKPMVDVVGMPLFEIVKLIRGEKGVPVRLRVLPAGEFESKLIEITRDTVVLSKIGSTLLTEENLPEGRTARVGFIDLPTFYANWKKTGEVKQDPHDMVSDVEQILQQFKSEQADVVVLDMRRNGGGALRSAIDLCGLFIGPGVMAQQKNSSGEVYPFLHEKKPAVWTSPLVLLTSKYSSGGTEIFAAALRDYRRGLILGDERTNGFGTSQHIVDLAKQASKEPLKAQLGVLRLTTNRLYSPGGEGMQLVGVTPHVSIPTALTGRSIGETSLKYALSRDRILPAKFQPLSDGLSDKLKTRLQANSKARQQDSPAFQKLAEQLAQAPNRPERYEYTLNLKKHIAAQKREEDKTVRLPGLIDTRLTPWLEEAFTVTLDYVAAQKFVEAEKLYGERKYAAGIEAYRAAVAADPNNKSARFKLAWTLSTCPIADARAGRDAVEQAKELCKQDNHQTWNYVLTLAIAEAEAGDFTNAQKHLAEALAAAPAAQRATYGYLTERFKNKQAFQ